MSIGIYMLVFTGTEKVYIGQSNCIERRYKEHLISFHNGSANSELLSAFNQYGTPELIILEETSLADLDIREIHYIAEYNSYLNGFNKTPGGTINHKPHHTNKYSNGKVPEQKIEEVFFLLLDINNKISSISEETGVSITVVRDIARLASHGWLKDKYPEEYAVLANIKNNKQRLSRANAKHNPTHKVSEDIRDLAAAMLLAGYRAKDVYAELNGAVSLSWVQKLSANISKSLP